MSLELLLCVLSVHVLSVTVHITIPISITGKKDVKNKPVINPDGGKMECETQPPVTGRGRSSSRGLCSICGQVAGRGLSHPCRPGDLKIVK